MKRSIAATPVHSPPPGSFTTMAVPLALESRVRWPPQPRLPEPVARVSTCWRPRAGTVAVPPVPVQLAPAGFWMVQS